MSDLFNSRDVLTFEGKSYGYYRIESLQENGLVKIEELPFSIRVLLEAVIRKYDGFEVEEKHIRELASWSPKSLAVGIEVPFKPARVILQDFTGVPAVVDLAAMRSAISRLGGDPKKINPLIPVDLVIDHSVQTDFYGSKDALEKNLALEFERNAERYSLLRWAQNSLENFRAVPPGVGIIHQVNLEYLANPVQIGKEGPEDILYPDSVLGTDSHTVMINGLGVLGWGVGGIEAEAVMLGQPYYMLAPEVIGFELGGELRAGVTATDLVLTITELLRKEGVVGKFVEFFGPGANEMPVATRAVLANMAPEYGATMGFFPVDEKTIEYLAQTGRTPHQAALVEAYCRANRLFRTTSDPVPKYTKILSFDLGSVEPALAGPKRPQDRIPLSEMKAAFEKIDPAGSSPNNGASKTADYDKLENGSVVIASITSCTNTSNPELMIAAGLLAKKAAERGLRSKPFVKTSLAPGSRVVLDYLEKADLMRPLESLGFNLVGFGCMSCIGNSGPLPDDVAAAVAKNDLLVAAVLSGNRNFEGRVNPLVKANYLASPPLVIAYALAGSVKIDFASEPLGKDANGNEVFLHDIWPSHSEISACLAKSLDPEMYRENYASVESCNEQWNAIPGADSELFDWNRKSTYIQEPPFLTGMGPEPLPVKSIDGARVLLVLGDSVTTDHISPAGSIKADSPAGKFLQENGVAAADFNSYGSRRGNDRVMSRGTFANIRIRNRLVPETEGGFTKYFPNGETMPVYDAAMEYRKTRTPLIILAGKEYGTGSSRDWAAKGTLLLGVRAVIASSFERIHRGNLIGMGILPLEFPADSSLESLGLTGEETYFMDAVPDDFRPGGEMTVRAQQELGEGRYSEIEFKVKVRIDTPVELVYYQNGGILQTVLRKLF